MNVSALEISAAGMRVQRKRMDLVAANLANVDSGAVRQAATVVAGSDGLPSLRVTLDASGIHPLVEMVDLISASRAYEANLAAAEVAKAMHQSTLRILG
jgi:flagellar basal body rod protein FlgC